jgi:hypothetical protein
MASAAGEAGARAMSEWRVMVGREKFGKDERRLCVNHVANASAFSAMIFAKRQEQD